MVYSKKEFYRNFYNNHLLRDFLFLRSNKNLKYDTDSPKSFDDNINTTKSNLNFLIKYTKANDKSFHGALISQVTYYKRMEYYLSKNESKRYANCLFFDFDSDSAELKTLKKSIAAAYDDLTGKNRINKIADIQQQYQNVLFSSDVLEKPFADAKKLYEYFKRYDINAYTVFSGSKGIHCYIFFDECNLINYTDISTALAKNYKKILDLSTLDLNVNTDAISRKSRVIYSKHETSGLFATPFDIESESISDVLESAKKQNITEFNLNDYIISDKSFAANLINYDKILSEKNAELSAIKKENLELKKSNANYSSRFIPDDAISIGSPDEVLKLNIFPCFENLEFTDYNNMLLVNLLFNTDISDAADVQKAMVIFWNDKDIKLELSKSGLKRVKQHENGKYAPTQNTMKKNDLCYNCTNWKNCFRYKMNFQDKYYDRIKNFNGDAANDH